MCGILGFYNFKNNDVTKQFIRNLSLRGRDGYGYAKIGRDFRIIKKSNENIEKINLSTTDNLYLFNSRAVPTTEYASGAGFDIDNQQPFCNDRFTVVHNGIISNDKELIKKYKLKPESKVDSAILPELFKKVGVLKGMRLLEGSFAILCYDKKEDKFYAGKNFLPLQCNIKSTGFMFYSTHEMNPYRKGEEFPNNSYIEIDMKTRLVNFYELYPSKPNKKVLIICSGGIDSVTTAYLYKHMGYDVNLIHFKYGQAAQKAELFAVNKFAKHLDSGLIVYDAVHIFKPFKPISKLLNQKEANPDEQMLDAESTLSYVPNRNAIFANIAAGVAEMLKCDTVSFGGQQMDSVYPDNNPGFVENINNSFQYSLSPKNKIKFKAPLIHLIKHEIVNLGQKIGVPYEDICSCYYPKISKGIIIHCNKCGCCQFKNAAFEMVENKDFIGDPKIFINKYVKYML